MIEELSNQITARSPKNGQFLMVAIDGRGGSGKSTLTDKLAPRLPGFTVIHGDDYWEPSQDSEFGWFNEDRFHHDVVEPLGKGRRHLTYRPYDWEAEPHGRSQELVVGAGIVIERCYSMGLRLDWDYTVWVDATPELALERGIGREPHQAEVWANLWLPREDAYIEREQPKARADTVIDAAEHFA
ncbi:uridine kinase family protein [Glycomyces buryatensis]|uniref:Uridine kinase n=1 Tax=Glycomyces buryatensis TaxID=2570927 RepID=A0A4S8QCZ1_9ACTN|nr:hypothetical protein [Glycomyces buryatensis]THV42170.1 hypothetical protein FAB82_08015 [Glycomyces buryatensis]